MASFSLAWKSSAAKELRKIDQPAIPRLIAAINDLREQPFPIGARKLEGSLRTYRTRVGDYRIVYEVHTEDLLIEIIRVRHRKDAYR